MSFVKLDSGILDSSLWMEPAEICKVFITVLAMTDSEGTCRATAPGIARRACLKLPVVRAALDRLESPDPESRSLEEDGRRLVRIDGGYRVVNYLKYRQKDHTAKERQRRHRATSRVSRSVTRDVTVSRPKSRRVTQAEVEAEADKKHKRTTDSGAVAPAFPSQRAADVYLRHYPEGKPPGAMFKELRPLVQKHGWEVVEPEMAAYLERTAIDYQSWPKFAAGFGTWANGNGARAGPNGKVKQREAQAVASVLGGLRKNDRWSVDGGQQGSSDAARPRLAAGLGGPPEQDPPGRSKPPGG